MGFSTLRNWIWVLAISSGCFGEAPNLGSGDASGTEGNDTTTTTTDTTTTTNGTTLAEEASSASSLDEGADATATGGEATSGMTATTTQAETTASEASEGTTLDDGTTDRGSSGNDETSHPVECAHYVFVTSENTLESANLGGLAGADAECSIAGEAVGGEWVAVLSTAAVNANARIDVTGPVCTLDDVVVAHDEAQWWSNAHLAPINVTQDAEPLPPGSWRVWTGTTIAGESSGTDCGAWTLQTSTPGVIVGDAHESNAHWVNNGTANTQCGFSARLYCFGSSF
jgi:hypothetical protein